MRLSRRIARAAFTRAQHLADSRSCRHGSTVSHEPAHNTTCASRVDFATFPSNKVCHANVGNIAHRDTHLDMIVLYISIELSIFAISLYLLLSPLWYYKMSFDNIYNSSVPPIKDRSARTRMFSITTKKCYLTEGQTRDKHFGLTFRLTSSRFSNFVRTCYITYVLLLFLKNKSWYSAFNSYIKVVSQCVTFLTSQILVYKQTPKTPDRPS